MKSLVSVLVLLCASQFAAAQMRPDPCANLPMGTGFVNDYSSCDAYFSCINGLPFEVRCPMPFHFNPHGPNGHPICDWPFNVDCRPCPDEGVMTIPNPHFCTKYTQCINGIAIDRDCAPGTAFDRQKGMCVKEEESVCGDINTCGKLEMGTGSAPSTVFCDKFIICYNGEQFGDPISCPSGLLFDSKHMRCALANDAVCFPGTLPSRASLPLAPTVRTH